MLLLKSNMLHSDPAIASVISAEALGAELAIFYVPNHRCLIGDAVVDEVNFRVGRYYKQWKPRASNRTGPGSARLASPGRTFGWRHGSG